MNNEFKPIYFWAQQLEDTSKNDFFEKSKNGLQEMSDVEKIQDIAYEMGMINQVEAISDENNFNNKLIIGLVVVAVVGGLTYLASDKKQPPTPKDKLEINKEKHDAK